MRTVGLPLRLGIGVLAATSAYAGVFAAPGGVGSGAMGNGGVAGGPIVVTTDAVALDRGAPSSAARAGYMVTSGRIRTR